VAIGRKKPKASKPGVSSRTGKGTTSKSKEEMAEISRNNGKNNVTRHKAVYEVSEPMGEMAMDVADMYADIYDPRAKIAPEFKVHAVACYFLTGTVEATAKMTGISHQTIADWKNHAQWWTPVFSKIKKEKNDELDSNLTGLLHDSTKELKDRLERGDTFFDGRSGEFKRKPIIARDLAAIVNILYDKRTMLRGDPTSITARQDPRKLLEELRGEFREMAREEAKEELNKTIVNEE